MQLFLSWSGNRSKAAAQILSDQLRQMIQSLQPWYSEQIESGVRWSAEIAKRLSETNYGVILVTPENQREPWLHFEAGALAKSVTDARVVPVLIDFEKKTDLVGPLSQFQTRLVNEDEIRKLVQDINHVSGQEIDSTILDRSFDAFWPQTRTALEQIAKTEVAAHVEVIRRPENMLEEVLERLRGQERLIRSIVSSQPPAVPPPRETGDEHDRVLSFLDELQGSSIVAFSKALIAPGAPELEASSLDDARTEEIAALLRKHDQTLVIIELKDANETVIVKSAGDVLKASTR